MVFTQPSTQNWSRAFAIWIQDIQVEFPTQAVARVIRGGFLRKVRAATRVISAVITVFFSLHCTRPNVAMRTLTAPRRAPVVASGVLPVFSGIMATPFYEETGLASWYGDGDGFEDMETASGEPLRPNLATCAHRTLPFGTLLEVENLENGQRTLARVNDRGPFVKGRVLDVSVRAARELGFRGRGVVSIALRTAVPEGLPLAVSAVLVPDAQPALPEPVAATPVALARDASSHLEVPLLRLVADTFWFLLGRFPSDDGDSNPAGRILGRPPYLHRETC